MNTFTLGVRNAFRNTVRSASITVILGLSIGLTLTMLVARQAVASKIDSVKSSVGNTISISPAGFSNFSQANNALTTDQLSKVKSLPHVTSLTETLNDRLSTIGSSTPFGGTASGTNMTNLASPVTLNSNGNGSFSSGGGGERLFIAGGGQLPSNFSPPITVLGTTDPSSFNGTALKITSGNTIDGSKDTSDALVSTDMASKNNLKVGSTFQAYNTTLTVAGIFDSGTRGGNNTIIMALPTVERLSGQSGDVTSATATVDSLDNLASTTTAVKNTLGSNNADVESSLDQANNTVKPLQNIKSISTVSLVGATIAGAIIILLTMIMIVRERRREIGVLKAIGASNIRVIFQFMSEAISLTLAGAIIGVILGVAGASPVTNALVSNSANSSTATAGGPGFQSVSGGGFAGGASGGPTFAARPTNSGGFFSRNRNLVGNSIRNIRTNVGWGILLDGLAAALVIAIVGSALAGWLIAKVRPSEVMRLE